MIERPCEYCDRGVALKTGNTNDTGIAIRYPNTLSAYGFCSQGFGQNAITVKINFCPMCGRKLVK